MDINAPFIMDTFNIAARCDCKILKQVKRSVLNGDDVNIQWIII